MALQDDKTIHRDGTECPIVSGCELGCQFSRLRGFPDSAQGDVRFEFLFPRDKTDLCKLLSDRKLQSMERWRRIGHAGPDNAGGPHGSEESRTFDDKFEGKNGLRGGVRGLKNLIQSIDGNLAQKLKGKMKVLAPDPAHPGARATELPGKAFQGCAHRVRQCERNKASN